MRSAVAFSLIILAAGSVGAHSSGSSRVYVQSAGQGPETLLVDMALIDLAQVIPLDRNGDDKLQWGEIASSTGPIISGLIREVRIDADGAACTLSATARDLSLIEYSGVPHLRVRLQVDCPPGRYFLSSTLFRGIDPEHRSLVRVSGPVDDRAYVLGPDSNAVPLSAEERWFASARGLVAEGFRHILSGYDHLVFLFLLILPAAVGGPVPRRLLRTAGIVTAFTAAHSITLAAATAGIVQLPAKPVEIAIAASIVFAAAVNVVRPGHRLGWKIAFTFGLLHGFGFAGALGELGFRGASLLLGLLSFNVGVELGQLLVVGLLLPVLAAVSASARYRPVVVPVASIACAALGVAWTAARMLAGA